MIDAHGFYASRDLPYEIGSERIESVLSVETDNSYSATSRALDILHVPLTVSASARRVDNSPCCYASAAGIAEPQPLL